MRSRRTSSSCPCPIFLQVLNAALLKPKAAATHPRTKKSAKAADAAAMSQTAEKPKTGAVC